MRAYGNRQYEKWDTQNTFAYVEKSVEKRVRGEEQAKMLEEKRNIARAMKADGLQAAQISKFTGLSLEEIQGL